MLKDGRFPRWLLIGNSVALVLLVLGGIDWYVRWRVGVGIQQYHQVVIVPMTKPRDPVPIASGSTQSDERGKP